MNSDKITLSLKNWLEPKILGAVVATSFAFWVFEEVAENVAEGDTRAIDTEILLQLHRADSSNGDWVIEFMRDISGLGGAGVLSLLIGASVIFLLLSKRKNTAIFVTLATGTGAILSNLLKLEFDRPRPDLIPHLTHVYSTSFPSGHAMVSAVVYLTLGTLLARISTGLWPKVFVMSVALLLTLLIGISRLYLGVHWPSDVVAGWAAGGAWALCWWLIAHLIKLENGKS